MKTIIMIFLKRILRKIFKKTQIDYNASNNDSIILLERVTNHGIPSFLDFSYDKLKTHTLSFVNSMKIGETPFEFKYSSRCQTPNIYSSAYAFIIFDMFGEIERMSFDEKKTG